MRKFSIAATIALGTFATSASAWEGDVIACYDTVREPAQYQVHQELVRAAYTEWEHRNGQAVQVHYPAVYVERRRMVRPERYVNRPAPCN
jgi:hypothetical protein